MRVKLRKRELPSGRRSLYLDISDRGKRRRQFLHLLLTGNRLQDKETLKRAERFRVKREAELLDSHLGTITNPHPKSQNFFDFADEIMETKGHARKVSLKTAVDHFRDCLGEDATLEGIGYTDIEGFRDYLKALPGISANSGNMYLICIRAIFNEAIKKRRITANPALGIGIKTTTKLPTFLELA